MDRREERSLGLHRSGVRSAVSRIGDSSRKVGVLLWLPTTQNKARLSVSGIADGCIHEGRDHTLSSPLQTTRVDARVGWQFEVRDQEGDLVFSF